MIFEEVIKYFNTTNLRDEYAGMLLRINAVMHNMLFKVVDLQTGKRVFSLI